MGIFLLPYSFLNHRADDHGDNHFYEVSRDKRNDTDGKSCFECVACNNAEPYSSEKIADDRSGDHTDELDQRFVAVVDYQSGNDGHDDKSDDISACRSGQFCRAACESGKYRKAYESKKQIDEITDGSFFPSKKIEGQVYCQIGEGDRNRADGDGQRGKNTGDSCHQCGHGDLVGFGVWCRDCV